MIVFSRPPGWRRRAGDPGSAGGFAEASVGTSSSVGDALRWPRKATLRAALQALTLTSRGRCDGPASRRATLLAEEPARPSDVSPFYESKDLALWIGPRALAEIGYHGSGKKS